MTPNLPAVASISDLEKMAASIVKSRLFGVENIDQAVTLMLVAQAEGLHPATAARDYHVIKGRPALKADAMLARFQQAGGKVEWDEYTDTRVCGSFSHPQSPKPVKIEWTIEMAKRIGLAGKDNWRNYPRAMLRARVISEGVRTCYPAIASGVYTPEEIQDFAPEKDITPMDARPTSGYLADLPAKRQEVMHETAQEVKALWANDQASEGYTLIENSGFDAEEMIALWSLLPADIKSAHKRMKDAERAHAAGTISKPKHQRIEAKIKELLLDRPALKAWCKEQFGVDSFPKLTDEQYAKLDAHIDALPVNQKATVVPQDDRSLSESKEGVADAGNGSQLNPAATTTNLTKQQKDEITALCEMAGININRLLLASKVGSIDELTDFNRCLKWIDAASKKEAK